MTIQDYYRAIAPGTVTEKLQTPKPSPKPSLDKPSEFQKVLEKQQVSFSKHAETRIKSREIPWNDQLEKRVSNAIDVAESKGSREALILADNVAIIANVKSRMIITAMDRNQMKEKIFTNIDSTVLA